MKHSVDCRHCAVVRLGTRPVVSAPVRFDARVRRSSTGCLIWTGAKTAKGYGNFWTGSRYMAAHRYSWERTNGPIADGLWVLHRCDTPLCVEPTHLFLGTPADNAADMVAKGRASRGEGRERAANGSWLPAERRRVPA